ncbi:zinc-ribbon domain-containing protein [Aestuariibius insulae]|uniref:zinc-ribbon domain-containing protein n=1 Tax=Aestuariibius insulae TaxID=2058287 RepID=UPI00345EA990
MRLTCPNCGAKYDIADTVLAKRGRDVQCSNCGKTWYQEAIKAEPESKAEAPKSKKSVETAVPATSAATAAAEPAEDVIRRAMAGSIAVEEQEPEPTEAEQRKKRVAEAITRIEKHGEETDKELARELGEVLDPEPEPPSIDPAVAAILRQEAEYEAEARRQDALEASGGSGKVKRNGVFGSGSSKLPRIEDINPTPRIDDDEEDDDDIDIEMGDPESLPRSSGFRLGFALTVIIFGLLVGVYVFHGNLTEVFPALSPVLSDYVGTVDTARMWMTDKMQAVVDNANTGGGAPRQSNITE